ncbi:hypothetical protein FACS189479_07380 [Spirochaetia bacterium]|nr:hypothetical protein FACS189479_07380 [Spirochaetia bacterium]
MKKSFVLSTTAILAAAVLVFIGCPGNNPPPDTTAPVLSAGGVSDLFTATGTTATLKFTSGEAGTYYYVVLASSDTAPTVDAIKAASTGIHGTGTALAAENTINVTSLTADATYKAYIVATDSSNNTSNVLTITGINPVEVISISVSATLADITAAVTSAQTAGKITGDGTSLSPYVVPISIDISSTAFVNLYAGIVAA